MSKFIKSAKNLLHHDKSPKATAVHDEADDSYDGHPRESSGSRMNSDVCVPQLGHTTGYDHNQLAQVDVPSQTPEASPTYSTSSKAPMSPPTGHTQLTSSSSPKHVSSHPYPDPVPQREDLSPLQLKSPAMDMGLDRPTCDLSVANSREREERVKAQVNEILR